MEDVLAGVGSMCGISGPTPPSTTATTGVDTERCAADGDGKSVGADVASGLARRPRVTVVYDRQLAVAGAANIWHVPLTRAGPSVEPCLDNLVVANVD
jgi:hypothetical protein